MNLWLDDIRPCPFIGNWTTAKNYEEAVHIMSSNIIEHAWLDHDLAPEHYQPGEESSDKTGYDFVVWMQENGNWPTKSCTVHSLNPVGSTRMCNQIADHYGTEDPQKHYVSFLTLTGRIW